MRTIDIPNERWPSFLNMLGKLANGRLVRIEVVQRDLGDQDMDTRLPLIDIDLETKGSEKGRIIVSVGSERGELTHLIGKPARLAVGVNDANEPQFVAIYEEGGASTIIHFEQLPALEAEYANP
jgi:uncharacterized protein DUF5335